MTEFISDWRDLKVGVAYWMIDRADPTDRNIIEITVRHKFDDDRYTCIQMYDSVQWRFRENTHVFVEIGLPPALPKELEYFPEDI